MERARQAGLESFALKKNGEMRQWQDGGVDNGNEGKVYSVLFCFLCIVLGHVLLPVEMIQE